MSGAAYEASPLNRRRRSTHAETGRLVAALVDIVEAMQPMTVRQVYYQAVVRGIVEKDDAGYDRVQRMLVKLRSVGVLPYEWLVDNTRWQRKPRTFRDPAHALRETARLYRKALWHDTDGYVEVWLEKDALAGVVMPITSVYDVPLMVSRGYASLSFLHEAAMDIRAMAQQDVISYIYHFGDYDPSGVNAAENIRDTLRSLSGVDIAFQRVAVTERQIVDLDLPTRPTKKSDSRAAKFTGESVELDAIAPETLRAMVQHCLESHLPAEQLKVLKVAEEYERSQMMAWAEALVAP